MGPAEWPQLLAALQSLGLKVVAIDKPLGRITVQVPDLEER